MKPFVSWALARLEEPSTYAGIAGLVAGMTFLPPADLALAAKAIASAALVVPSLLAIIIPEGSSK